jgi:excisionase family DNA binding protein
MTGEIRWLTVREAADRARCGPKTIYRAVKSRQLRAARIGGRRELRFLATWIDSWLIGEENAGEARGAGRGPIGSSLERSAATPPGSTSA